MGNAAKGASPPRPRVAWLVRWPVQPPAASKSVVKRIPVAAVGPVNGSWTRPCHQRMPRPISQASPQAMRISSIRVSRAARCAGLGLDEPRPRAGRTRPRGRRSRLVSGHGARGRDEGVGCEKNAATEEQRVPQTAGQGRVPGTRPRDRQRPRGRRRQRRPGRRSSGAHPEDALASGMKWRPTTRSAQAGMNSVCPVPPRAPMPMKMAGNPTPTHML